MENSSKDWDQHLPYVLFAYRASQQQSTLESPFSSLYGRDPRLPVESVESKTKASLDLSEYGVDIAAKMSSAWKLARQCTGKAQKCQKANYCMTRGASRQPLGLETVCFCLSHLQRLEKHKSLLEHFMDPLVCRRWTLIQQRSGESKNPTLTSLLVSLDRL